jgi:hypothetical protein
MGQFINNMLAGSRRIRGYAEKLAVGIDPKLAARKPRFDTTSGVVVIDTNHPSFVYGHLGLYPAKMLTKLGADGSGIAPPQEWEELFKPGAKCIDDEKGTVYPAMSVLLSHFLRSTERAEVVMQSMDDSVLLKPNADEQRREMFPTDGAFVEFLLGPHVMLHFGQLSAWRRCNGLPSAM